MGQRDQDDAGSTVVRALAAVRDRLHEYHPLALTDEPDALHQMRTDVRRLRSLLAAYGAVLDGGVATELRRRLRELGRELGTVRDLEVRVQVAEDALEAGDAAGRFVSAEERSRVRGILIDDEMIAHDRAHARFAERQRLPRAIARLEELDRMLARPPFTEYAARPAEDELARLLDHEGRRAEKRGRRLPEDPTLEDLHELRKAARRLRYAAEAVTRAPVELFGDAAVALAEAGDAIHDVLGDHRDELLFAEHLRRSAAHASHAGDPAEALLRLAEDADARAEGHLAKLPGAIGDLTAAAAKWHGKAG